MPLIGRVNPTPTYIDATRWVEVYNNSFEEIPSFALLRVTGSNSATQVLTVNKPSANGQDVIVNGPTPIPINGNGVATRETPVTALYDTGDGTPANGETWGAGASSWKLRKNNSGFTICGGPINGRVVVMKGCCGATTTGTSTTSQAIATGSVTLQTQTDLVVTVGDPVLISSDANPANYMQGVVTSYSGGSLTVNVDQTGGSGTHADWTITSAATADSSPRIVKVTKSYTDFQTASTTIDLTLYTLGAGYVLKLTRVVLKTVFAGTGVTSCVVVTGTTSLGTTFQSSASVLSPVAVNTVLNPTSSGLNQPWSASLNTSTTNLIARMTANVNLSNLTAGSLEFEFEVVKAG